MNIKITGFRDSFPKFVGRYLREILDFKVEDRSLFDNIKEKQQREY